MQIPGKVYTRSEVQMLSLHRLQQSLEICWTRVIASDGALTVNNNTASPSTTSSVKHQKERDSTFWVGVICSYSLLFIFSLHLPLTALSSAQANKR